MFRNTLIGVIATTSLSLGGLFIDSANAQNAPNNSDNTGTNTSDLVIGGVSSALTAETVAQGEQIANDIELAFNEDTDITLANNQSEENTANKRRCQKRMFVLDQPDPNSSCNTAENLESEQLAALERADEFLQQVDQRVAEINREIEINRLW